MGHKGSIRIKRAGALGTGNLGGGGLKIVLFTCCAKGMKGMGVLSGAHLRGGITSMKKVRGGARKESSGAGIPSGCSGERRGADLGGEARGRAGRKRKTEEGSRAAESGRSCRGTQ